MPETPTQGSPQIIALAMLISVITLVVLAVLIYTGTIPIPEETRFVAALLVGLAAFADMLVAIWFFRKGQSS
jgi:Co/Zn/Cd efflux system component